MSIKRKLYSAPDYWSDVSDVSNLEKGSLVDHYIHGVGRFEQVVEVGGTSVLMISYEGTDKLYLPVHRIAAIKRVTKRNAKVVPLSKRNEEGN